MNEDKPSAGWAKNVKVHHRLPVAPAPAYNRNGEKTEVKPQRSQRSTERHHGVDGNEDGANLSWEESILSGDDYLKELHLKRQKILRRKERREPEKEGDSVGRPQGEKSSKKPGSYDKGQGLSEGAEPRGRLGRGVTETSVVTSEQKERREPEKAGDSVGKPQGEKISKKPGAYDKAQGWSEGAESRGRLGRGVVTETSVATSEQKPGEDIQKGSEDEKQHGECENPEVNEKTRLRKIGEGEQMLDTDKARSSGGTPKSVTSDAPTEGTEEDSLNMKSKSEKKDEGKVRHTRHKPTLKRTPSRPTIKTPDDTPGKKTTRRRTPPKLERTGMRKADVIERDKTGTSSEMETSKNEKSTTSLEMEKDSQVSHVSSIQETTRVEKRLEDGETKHKKVQSNVMESNPNKTSTKIVSPSSRKLRVPTSSSKKAQRLTPEPPAKREDTGTRADMSNSGEKRKTSYTNHQSRASDPAPSQEPLTSITIASESEPTANSTASSTSQSSTATPASPSLSERLLTVATTCTSANMILASTVRGTQVATSAANKPFEQRRIPPSVAAQPQTPVLQSSGTNPAFQMTILSPNGEQVLSMPIMSLQLNQTNTTAGTSLASPQYSVQPTGASPRTIPVSQVQQSRLSSPVLQLPFQVQQARYRMPAPGVMSSSTSTPPLTSIVNVNQIQTLHPQVVTTTRGPVSNSKQQLQLSPQIPSTSSQTQSGTPTHSVITIASATSSDTPAAVSNGSFGQARARLPATGGILNPQPIPAQTRRSISPIKRNGPATTLTTRTISRNPPTPMPQQRNDGQLLQTGQRKMVTTATTSVSNTPPTSATRERPVTSLTEKQPAPVSRPGKLAATQTSPSNSISDPPRQPQTNLIFMEQGPCASSSCATDVPQQPGIFKSSTNNGPVSKLPTVLQRSVGSIVSTKQSLPRTSTTTLSQFPMEPAKTTEAGNQRSTGHSITATAMEVSTEEVPTKDMDSNDKKQGPTTETMDFDMQPLDLTVKNRVRSAGTKKTDDKGGSTMEKDETPNKKVPQEDEIQLIDSIPLISRHPELGINIHQDFKGTILFVRHGRVIRRVPAGTTEVRIKEGDISVQFQLERADNRSEDAQDNSTTPPADGTTTSAPEPEHEAEAKHSEERDDSRSEDAQHNSATPRADGTTTSAPGPECQSEVKHSEGTSGEVADKRQNQQQSIMKSVTGDQKVDTHECNSSLSLCLNAEKWVGEEPEKWASGILKPQQLNPESNAQSFNKTEQSDDHECNLDRNEDIKRRIEPKSKSPDMLAESQGDTPPLVVTLRKNVRAGEKIPGMKGKVADVSMYTVVPRAGEDRPVYRHKKFMRDISDDISEGDRTMSDDISEGILSMSDDMSVGLMTMSDDLSDVTSEGEKKKDSIAEEKLEDNSTGLVSPEDDKLESEGNKLLDESLVDDEVRMEWSPDILSPSTPEEWTVEETSTVSDIFSTTPKLSTSPGWQTEGFDSLLVQGRKITYSEEPPRLRRYDLVDCYDEEQLESCSYLEDESGVIAPYDEISGEILEDLLIEGQAMTRLPGLLAVDEDGHGGEADECYEEDMIKGDSILEDTQLQIEGNAIQAARDPPHPSESFGFVTGLEQEEYSIYDDVYEEDFSTTDSLVDSGNGTLQVIGRNVDVKEHSLRFGKKQEEARLETALAKDLRSLREILLKSGLADVKEVTQDELVLPKDAAGFLKILGCEDKDSKEKLGEIGRCLSEISIAFHVMVRATIHDETSEVAQRKEFKGIQKLVYESMLFNMDFTRKVTELLKKLDGQGSHGWQSSNQRYDVENPKFESPKGLKETLGRSVTPDSFYESMEHKRKRYMLSSDSSDSSFSRSNLSKSLSMCVDGTPSGGTSKQRKKRVCQVPVMPSHSDDWHLELLQVGPKTSTPKRDVCHVKGRATPEEVTSPTEQEVHANELKRTEAKTSIHGELMGTSYGRDEEIDVCSSPDSDTMGTALLQEGTGVCTAEGEVGTDGTNVGKELQVSSHSSEVGAKFKDVASGVYMARGVVTDVGEPHSGVMQAEDHLKDSHTSNQEECSPNPEGSVEVGQGKHRQSELAEVDPFIASKDKRTGEEESWKHSSPVQSQDIINKRSWSPLRVASSPSVPSQTGLTNRCRCSVISPTKASGTLKECPMTHLCSVCKPGSPCIKSSQHVSVGKDHVVKCPDAWRNMLKGNNGSKSHGSESALDSSSPQKSAPNRADMKSSYDDIKQQILDECTQHVKELVTSENSDPSHSHSWTLSKLASLHTEGMSPSPHWKVQAAISGYSDVMSSVKEIRSDGDNRDTGASDSSDDDNQSKLKRYLRATRRSRRSRDVSPEVISVSGRRRGFQQASVCKKIVNEIWNMEESDPFAFERKRKHELPADYYEVIRRPMWLEWILRKLGDRTYNNLREFVHDVRRIFWNCHKYNKPGSKIVAGCEKLEEVFDGLLLYHFPQEYHHISAITGDPKECQLESKRRPSEGEDSTNSTDAVQ